MTNTPSFEQLFKILLLGDSGVGKSSIIQRFTRNEFNAQMVSSVGVDFKSKDLIINNKRVKLQVWDTAGHERFRTITTSYYRGAHAIVTVFDLSDRETYEHVEKWLEEINKFAKENVLKFLVGNKSDLTNKRQVSSEEIRALVSRLAVPYFEVSAKTADNLFEFFEEATRVYLSKYDFKKDKEKAGISLDKNKLGKKKKDGCC